MTLDPKADAVDAGVLRAERRMVFILAAVTFVNILDFMMVMPLGPDLAAALAIPLSQLGVVGGSYTAAAAIAGLITATFLDRFDRRRALAVAMSGLVIATAAGGLARGFSSLVATRILAGAFGGPAAALGLAILADAVAPQRRGRAMGAVMGAFAAASVLGVPAGLELAHLGSWRTPFFSVAALGVVVAVLALLKMPAMRGHLVGSHDQASRSVWEFAANRSVQLALLGTTVFFMGTFALIPHLATYLQFNLGFPRGRLGMIYMMGGIVSFFAMRIGGIWVDRKGPVLVTVIGSVAMVLVLATGFVITPPLLPVVLLFVGLMLANVLRSVAMNTLSSRVPGPRERGRFMSAQSAVQHSAASIGAMISTLFLTEGAHQHLEGIPLLAMGSIVLASALPVIIWRLNRRVVLQTTR